MALCTADEVRTQIPSLASGAETTLLETLISGCGTAFARWCAYPGVSPSMERATRVSYLDGDGTRDLVVDVWPLVSVTSVYDDPSGDFTSSTYLVSSGDYTILEPIEGSQTPRTVRLVSTASHGTWIKGKRNVKITYVAGFGAGSPGIAVPDDLKRLVAMGVRNWFDLRGTQGKASVSQGESSVTYRDEDFLPPLVRQGLSAFRLPGAYL